MMRFVASFCRKQEAIQLCIAENDPLESRRKIAAVAATAWRVKSKEAEAREAEAREAEAREAEAREAEKSARAFVNP